MSDALATFASGVRQLRARDFAVYAGAGVAANGLLVAGLPKVGGMLSGMALATYLAGVQAASLSASGEVGAE